MCTAQHKSYADEKGGTMAQALLPLTTPLYLHPPTSDGFSAGDMADQGAKAFAARDPEVEELRGRYEQLQTELTARDEELDRTRELLNALTCSYAAVVQAGHDHITALGGDCDSVSKMLADFPAYAQARALLEPKQGGACGGCTNGCKLDMDSPTPPNEGPDEDGGAAMARKS